MLLLCRMRLSQSHACFAPAVLCASKAAAGESICLGFYCPGLVTQAIIDDSGKVSKRMKAVTDKYLKEAS